MAWNEYDRSSMVWEDPQAAIDYLLGLIFDSERWFYPQWRLQDSEKMHTSQSRAEQTNLVIVMPYLNWKEKVGMMQLRLFPDRAVSSASDHCPYCIIKSVSWPDQIAGQSIFEDVITMWVAAKMWTPHWIIQRAVEKSQRFWLCEDVCLCSLL